MTIIAFISQKGGVGKSTLTQALAVEAPKQKIDYMRHSPTKTHKVSLKIYL